MRTYSAHPREAGAAFWVAHYAELLLDAVIEQRVKASEVRDLAEAIADLKANMVGGSFDDRAIDLIDANWESAKPEYEGTRYPRFVLEEKDEEGAP